MSETSPFLRLLGTEARRRTTDLFLRRFDSTLTEDDIRDRLDLDAEAVEDAVTVLTQANIITENGNGYCLNPDAELTQTLGATHKKTLLHSQDIPPAE